MALQVRPYPSTQADFTHLILHALWLPSPEETGHPRGAFFLWAEHHSPLGERGVLKAPSLKAMLQESLPEAQEGALLTCTEAQLPLPTQTGGLPWPSGDMAQCLGLDLPSKAELKPWRVEGLQLAAPLRLFKKLPSAWRRWEAQVGQSLLFWLHVLHAAEGAVHRAEVIPAIRWQEARPNASKPQGGLASSAWECISPQMEAQLKDLAQAMPLGSRVVFQGARFRTLQAESMLHHATETCLQEHFTHLPQAAKLLGPGCPPFLAACLSPHPPHLAAHWEAALAYAAWRSWRDGLREGHLTAPFRLAFRLSAPPEEGQGPWALDFLAVLREDPTQMASFELLWGQTNPEQAALWRIFGTNFEATAKLLLEQAAAIYPLLAEALDEPNCVGLDLSLEEAFAFLQEEAWLLQEAGFAVQVPTWWSPEGRQRLKAKVARRKKRQALKALPSGQNWLRFEATAALGDEELSPEEWASLVAARQPLVRFRGTWVVVEPSQVQAVQALLEVIDPHRRGLSIQDVLRLSAKQDKLLFLGPCSQGLLDPLNQTHRLPAALNPKLLKGQLRDYQRRGLAWLLLLEQVGLNGCLADDMGLGKSIQLLALLLHEREGQGPVGPTLLVAPTTVLGNWARETARFAPSLKVVVHHGPSRQKAPTPSDWTQGVDLILTSYALLWRDADLLQQVAWHRVVLDEAQQVKNPMAKASGALLGLQANHRLALTGTPVENRLLDLWSIFHFLNPGLLGSTQHFRKHFENPIQKRKDPKAAEHLSRLTGPLILRRLKTDPAIAKDLPAKVAQKHLLGLSLEQAALYEGLVREFTGKAAAAEGLKRELIILECITKLKQLCNHPALFLQDGSPFSLERSPKLQALVALAQEARQGGESLLVFSQYVALGKVLVPLLKKELGVVVHFLHGGSTTSEREAMIQAFQAPEAPPALFFLSLKAGGVGINLTKASQVVHVDRWWNPAVEDQATDRAYRIGQHRTVFVHTFITEGSLEERIDALLEQKRQVADGVVGGGDSWLGQLDDAAFQALIALDSSALHTSEEEA